MRPDSILSVSHQYSLNCAPGPTRRKLKDLASTRIAVIGPGVMGAASVFWARQFGARAIVSVARNRTGEKLVTTRGRPPKRSDTRSINAAPAVTRASAPLLAPLAMA